MSNTTKPTSPLQEQGRTAKGQFAKGHTQNPHGRAKGSRNKATLAAQALLDGEVEALTRKAVEMALEGDTTALRLCLERIIPARKESPLPATDLPVVTGAADLPDITAAILNAVTSGQITPGEGQSLSALVAAHGKAVELAQLEERIAALEERQSKGDVK